MGEPAEIAAEITLPGDLETLQRVAASLTNGYARVESERNGCIEAITDSLEMFRESSDPDSCEVADGAETVTITIHHADYLSRISLPWLTLLNTYGATGTFTVRDCESDYQYVLSSEGLLRADGRIVFAEPYLITPRQSAA